MSNNSHKITALVIDDEMHARENLKMLLHEFCNGIEVIGEACGKEDAKRLIEETNPDVIFLDIRMPSGAEGFELLDSIQNKSFQVIFVTAFKDYAIKAFKANAIHYILKPIDIDELIQAVDKIKITKQTIEKSTEQYIDYFKRLEELTHSLTDTKSSKISIRHSKGIKIIEDDTILRLQAENNYTMLYFSDGTSYLDTRTLKAYEELLDENKFSRIHKSHIINLNFLADYSNQDGHFAVMNNGDVVPISRAKLGRFIEKMKSL